MVSLFASLLGVACSDPDPPPSACDSDPLGCGTGQTFALDPDCANEAPLDVILGEGDTRFTPLETGDTPELHFGGQGGQHLALGLRITNPDSAHLLFLTKWTVAAVAPGQPIGGQQLPMREIVLGSGDFADGPSGSVEQSGFIVQVYDDFSLGGRIVLEVADACNRHASVEHDFTLP